MITRFQVQNYKALRDVTLDLTPMHVLIGPNDTGKTSILEALTALCRSVDYPLQQAFTGSWEGYDLVWRHTPDLPVSFSVEVKEEQHQFVYQISCLFVPRERTVHSHREHFTDAKTSRKIDWSRPHLQGSLVYAELASPGSAPTDKPGDVELVHRALSGVHFYRWNPRFLALPVAPDTTRRFRMDSSGFGLALCLDDILGYDREQFTHLENRFRAIFPQIKSIRLMQEPAYRGPVDDPIQIPILAKADGKGIYFELVNGQQVPASQTSDGVLLVLAYLTVLYLPAPHRPRVVLVEEPENGIHPKRLQDVLGILRDLIKEQTTSQVILTTHSPYVLDLFEPEEVSLCYMSEDRAVAIRRLSESQTIHEQIDIFTLGEIWTAEGDAALIPQDKSGEATS
jgi:energy-coupling factor transporter ATP-binding protein EcfA2